MLLSRVALVATLLLLLVACKDTKEPPSCASRAKAFGRWIDAVAREGVSGVAIDREDVSLVVLEDAPPLRRQGTIVTIGKAQTRVDGRPVADAIELADHLRAMSRMRLYTEGDGALAPPVYLAADGDAPFLEVAKAAGAVAFAGQRQVGFLFGRASTVQPPPPSSISKDLEALLERDPAERVTGMAQLAQKIYADCPHVLKVFQLVGTLSPEVRASTFARELPDALVRCKCGCDFDALRSYNWALLGPPPGGSLAGALEVNLAQAEDPDVHPVAITATIPWREAHRAFVEQARRAGGKPVRLDALGGPPPQPDGGAAAAGEVLETSPPRAP